MRNLISGRTGRSAAARWTGSAVLAVAVAGGAVALSPAAASAHTDAAAAQAITAHAVAAPARSTKSAVVVKERVRKHHGKILVTTKGHALYYLPAGSCTAACLSIWPRLVMPKGKTIPRGATCLGTAKFGTNHRLQVTYRKKRLYTFTGDSGISVNGNGLGGFKVATVMKCK
jgi:predicted lipoprotein with Yx(FWY)xxD motif